MQTLSSWDSNINELSSEEDENENYFVLEEDNNDNDEQTIINLHTELKNDKNDFSENQSIPRKHYKISTALKNPVDFIEAAWLELHYSEDDIRQLPKGFSFSPGWHCYRLRDQKMSFSRIKQVYLVQICDSYGLSKYFSLIYNIIRINTYTENNSLLSIEFCFHLICNYFSKKLNLGEGINIKMIKKWQHYKFINIKNFNRVYKSQEYWMRQATVLYQIASEKALNDFQILKSSLTPLYLYNLLLLIPKNHSISVAFCAYVHYALKNTQTENCLLDFNEKQKLHSIVEKRFQKYIKYALSKHTKLSKIMKLRKKQ
ncbi:hypothetical protein NUSPORA_02359 [Nucleospora cyclopteri]